MKAEYTNLFKFAITPETNEAHFVFEQSFQGVRRDSDDPEKLTLEDAEIVTVSSLVMNISCVKTLVSELTNALQSLEEDAKNEVK